MSILRALFEHNRWANLRLLDACAGETEECLDATCVGTAGTIRHTLLHISRAEQRYVHRLGGPAPSYGEGRDWPGAAALREALEQSGTRLIELVETVPPDLVLDSEYQGKVYRLPVTTVFVQAINHATEHRSQVATILTQQGIEPPDMSGWAFGS